MTLWLVPKRSIVMLLAGCWLCGAAWSGTHDRGQEAYRQGQYAAAIKEFKRGAKHHEPSALFALGVMHQYGQGTPKSDKAAVHWYRQAAMRGHTSAQYFLATMVEKGRGTPPNAKEAARWYRKAAEQGLALAQYHLGRLYAQNPGSTTAQTGEAAAWYTQAAQQGHADAQFHLGQLYAQGLGVPQSHVHAAAWYGRAAAQGHSEAQTSLGLLHEAGQGAEANLVEAYAWLDVASATGSSAANGHKARVGQQLTPAQRQEAMALSSQWQTRTMAPQLMPMGAQSGDEAAPTLLQAASPRRSQEQSTYACHTSQRP